LKITTLGILLAILVVSFILIKISSLDKTKKEYISGATLILFLAFILYGLSLLFAYIYYFYPNEAMSAPSLERYLASYVLGWWLFVLAYAFQQEPREIPFLHTAALDLLIGVLLVVMVAEIPVTKYIHLPTPPGADRIAVDKIYKAVKGDLTAPNEKVYDVWQTDSGDGLKHIMLQYFLSPIPTNKFGWQVGEGISDSDLVTVDLSGEQWLDLLNTQKYTYVLISSADNNFWDTYYKLFNSYDRNNLPQLFRVTPDKLIQVDLNQK
jgi:hypothetical protein